MIMFTYTQKLLLGNIIKKWLNKWFEINISLDMSSLKILFKKEENIIIYNESNETMDLRMRRYFFLKKIIDKL